MTAHSDARILIVDDQQSNVLLLEQLLKRQGYTHVTSILDSRHVVERFETDPPDLMLLDLQMPEPDGFEIMKLVEQWTTGHTYVPVLVLTADASHATKLRALEAGARDFLSKPFEFVEVTLRIRNLLQTRSLQMELQALNRSLESRVRHRTRELEQARTEAFRRLGIAAEYRDDDTREHTKRVGITAGMLAAQLGLEPSMVDVIEWIAPLHDVGKIGIPDSILLKQGGLTEDEIVVMRTHTTIGQEMLAGSSSPVLEAAAEIALTHHERWDGSGYPAGLKGAEIPINGRIVALADAFDAMTHARPYKQAMPIADAVAEVERSSGSHFDPAVVAAFGHLDPRLLVTPPPSKVQPRLSEQAWLALEDLTGTARDEAEQEHVTGAAIKAILADTPTAALITDDHRRFISANASACEMFGLDIDKLRTMRVDDFFPESAAAELEALWAKLLRVGLQNFDGELLLTNGSTLMATCRGVAHLLPGRHLSLVTPIDDSPRGTSVPFVAGVHAHSRPAVSRS